MTEQKVPNATNALSSASWMKAGCAALLCLLSGVVGAALTRNMGTSTQTIPYADFVSIMLAAVSLLMTLLGFFIAGLAFIGWNAITARVHDRTREFLETGFNEGGALHGMLETSAKKVVEDRTKHFLDDGFKEGNALSEMLKERAIEAMFAGVDQIGAEERVEGRQEDKGHE